MEQSIQVKAWSSLYVRARIPENFPCKNWGAEQCRRQNVTIKPKSHGAEHPLDVKNKAPLVQQKPDSSKKYTPKLEPKDNASICGHL